MRYYEKAFMGKAGRHFLPERFFLLAYSYKL
jgi:hypothetical protein